MTESWELILHRQAARTFFTCRGTERIFLEKLMDSLSNNPYQEYQTEAMDSTGRANRVRKAGRWSVVYWLDSFPKEVRIVSLERDTP